MDRLKHAGSNTRPFGDAVLDGSVLCQSNELDDPLTPLYRVDLDIESGSPEYYSTFVKELRTLSKNSDKQYVVLSYTYISNSCLQVLYHCCPSMSLPRRGIRKCNK